MNTIWENKQTNYEKLNKNVECDVAIIGGGIAGLWCAYNLIKAGKKVVILEARKIGLGVTSGSSAILTYAQENVQKVYNLFGEEIAKKHLSDLKNSIFNIVKIIKEENFNCNLAQTKFTLFAKTIKGKSTLKKIEQVYKNLGEGFEKSDFINLPYKKVKALTFDNCFLIDPLMLVNCLADFVIKNHSLIFENTKVVNQPINNELLVNGYKITAENFIVATHFPYINFPGFYFMKMYQDQNYSIVFKPTRQFKCIIEKTTFESLDKNGFEFRSAKGNVLCCGPDVRTGSKPYKSKYQVVQKHLEKYFDSPEEITRFSAQDCITSDYLPYAGYYSSKFKNVYVLTGFNKWGMTNSFITSMVVCNYIIYGKPNENIYDPVRNNFFVTIIDTLSNVSVAAINWVNNLFSFDSKKFNRLKPGLGAIVKHNGHRLAVYKDEQNNLHVISGICPHLGCSLKWNKDELSWDCPCHGSRFDVDGKIINNPSIKDADKIKLSK